jgi:hypothetical protein
MDTNLLIEGYRQAARQHGDATEIGDYKSANRFAESVATIFAELKRRGPQSQQLLLKCLEDPSPGVRLWAASHALEFAPAKAEKVLGDLSKGGRLVDVSAAVTLKEWHSGRLRFPHPKK